MLKWLLLLTGPILYGQYISEHQLPATFVSNQNSFAALDTIMAPAAGDSCQPGWRYYQINGRIVTGAALLNNGQSITHLAQWMPLKANSMNIESLVVPIVYKSAGSGTAGFRVIIYDSLNLNNPRATSVPRFFNQINDSSDVSLLNPFYFSPPVIRKEGFWAVIEVISGSDSIYLASTQDDCGQRSTLMKAANTWYYLADQFEVGPQDALDVSLPLMAVGTRYMGNRNESILAEVEFYPQPAQERLHLQLPRGISNKLEFRIMDVTGRVVHAEPEQKKISSHRITLQLDHLRPGSYWLQMRLAGAQRVHPLIIALRN